MQNRCDFFMSTGSHVFMILCFYVFMYLYPNLDAIHENIWKFSKNIFMFLCFYVLMNLCIPVHWNVKKSFPKMTALFSCHWRFNLLETTWCVTLHSLNTNECTWRCSDTKENYWCMNSWVHENTKTSKQPCSFCT